MARRLDAEDTSPHLTPERLARMMADMEALDRGELPVITLDEYEAAATRAGDGALDMATLPWRTGRERGWIP